MSPSRSRPPDMIRPPRYTMVPNEFLGDRGTPGLMASLSGSECKVFIALCRLTFGFRQETTCVSIPTLTRMTGLSKQGVLNAANGLIDKKLVQRTVDNSVGEWELLVKKVDGGVKKLDPPPSNNLTPPVKKLDPRGQKNRPPSIKETFKETSERKDEAEIFSTALDNYLIKPSEIGKQMVADALDEYGPEKVMAAMKEAVAHNARSWRYVEKVLDGNGRSRDGGPVMDDDWREANEAKIEEMLSTP